MKLIKNHLFMFLLLVSFNLQAQERFITVDGQSYRIKEIGSGEQTVIFECGMSDSIEAWGTIPDTIATQARVFMYDRADIGKSDTSNNERTIPNMVLELHNILAAAGEKPPYVFVGHSMGGFIGRFYCSEYPDEITGLLLLDPAPENFWESMTKRQLKKYLKGGDKWYTKYPPQYRKEWYMLIPNLNYMHQLNIVPDLPIILVSASKSNWFYPHEKIIEGFTNARHIELEGGHYIHREHPEKTLSYIRELLDQK